MQIGILGLGTMGSRIAQKLMQEGHQVVVWNRSREILDQWRVEKAEFIISQKLIINHSISEYRESLIKPRIFWAMLPAGEPTESVLQQLLDLVEAGDIVIDGGNSNFKDTERRFGLFQQKGVKFLGIGMAGGIHGQESGFSQMVGGDQGGYEYIRPILDSLAKPYGCHTYFGTGGVGHYLKMIHSGIEYSMMQSLGEGFGLLAKSNYRVNFVDVANTWQQGSIIEGFLLQMVIDALTKDPVLAQTEGYIGETDEGNWAVEEAKEKHVAVTAIEQALLYRRNSQYDKGVQESIAAKLIQAMRKEFSGHDEVHPSIQQPPQGSPQQPPQDPPQQ